MNDILLVRLDGLGDALACVPMLEGLARRYSEARFHVVCSARNAGVFSPARVRTLEAEAVGFRGLLKTVEYDAAIVATDEVAGYEIARLSGAPRRVGFWHRFEKPFKSIWQRSQLTDAVYRPAGQRRAEHEVEVLYRLAAALGAPPKPPADPNALRRWLHVDRDSAGERAGAVGFQVTAKLASGSWGPSALGKCFAAALAAAGSRRCALLCARADEELARAVLEHLVAARADFERISQIVGASVSHWFGVIDALDALVSPDTGAAHAAGMLGVPVVDLFDCDRFEQSSRRWRPWASPSRCLVKPRWRPGLEDALGAEIGGALQIMLSDRDGIARGSRSSMLIS